MTHPAPRLTARSVVAIADLELLRVARTDLDQPDAPVGSSVVRRLRDLARFAVGRPEPDALGPAISLGEDA